MYGLHAHTGVETTHIDVPSETYSVSHSVERHVQINWRATSKAEPRLAFNGRLESDTRNEPGMTWLRDK